MFKLNFRFYFTFFTCKFYTTPQNFLVLGILVLICMINHMIITL